MDLASEFIVTFFVIIRNSRFSIHAYIHTFVSRIQERLSFWNFAFSYFLIVHIQTAGSSGARFSTIKFEFIFKQVLARTNWLGTTNFGSFQSEIIVFVV